MRYITPENIMAMRFGKAAPPRWDVAVLCFRDLTGSRLIIGELGAAALGERILWGMYEFPEDPRVHELRIGQHRVCVVGQCIWGGPQASIVVEELACLGVKHIIGIGAAGSIDAAFPKGSQLVAASSLATDGTTRAYTDDGEVHADARLLAIARAAGGACKAEVHSVRAATVDAIYRETHAAVLCWAGQGAHVLNMETAPFYAASAACGVAGVWIGHVSDCIVGGYWEGWDDIGGMTVTSARIARAMLERILGGDGNG